MKYALSLFILLMGSHQMQAAHGPEILCRQYVVAGDFGSEIARLAADLTNGVWFLKTDRLGDAQGQLIFHDYGSADEIVTNADGSMVYQRMQWSIEAYNGAYFLVVTQLEAEGRTNLYRMQPDCEGIALTDAASLERIKMVHFDVKPKAVQEMSHYLTGSWVSTEYPFDIATTMDEPGTFEPMNGAFLQYAFKGNGTFVREWGNIGVSHREQGYWDITADGEYLLLHITDGENDKVLKTEVARIQYMGDGYYKVRQALEVGSKDDFYRTKVKDFSFQRWTSKG